MPDRNALMPLCFCRCSDDIIMLITDPHMLISRIFTWLLGNKEPTLRLAPATGLEVLFLSVNILKLNSKRRPALQPWFQRDNPKSREQC